MRPILRKITDGVPLKAGEYERLLAYIEELRQVGGDSYRVFRENYGTKLGRDYGFYLSRYSAGGADLVEYLAANPSVVRAMQEEPVPVASFPPWLRDYLLNEYGLYLKAGQIGDLLSWLRRERITAVGLPRGREGEAVLVYEEGNPYKETGLKQHFENIARRSFVTRVVSIRYLTRNKARADGFKVRGDDCLSGIFTNREKSIYYLVYLTEADAGKAENACKLLNQVFYG
ncbi:MAG: hypothetical protein GX964_04705 [Syntrophomonadaceae bacterium]|nr:hypothetical protein [Syntrophomonadaceae bacterium]